MGQLDIYTDEHLKWDKPPNAVCLFNLFIGVKFL